MFFNRHDMNSLLGLLYMLWTNVCIFNLCSLVLLYLRVAQSKHYHISLLGTSAFPEMV